MALEYLITHKAFVRTVGVEVDNSIAAVYDAVVLYGNRTRPLVGKR